MLAQFCKARWARTIGRFLPTLAAASHAGDQAQGIGVFHPVAKEFVEHGFKLAWLHTHDAAWKFTRGHHLACGVQLGAPQ